MILNTIKVTGLQDDRQKALEILTSLTKTNKFDLAAKCLTKKEKNSNIIILIIIFIIILVVKEIL